MERSEPAVKRRFAAMVAVLRQRPSGRRPPIHARNWTERIAGLACMPVIIAIAGLKGGVGKSTLALQLATEHSLRGRRPLLVDLDPIGTLRMSSDRAVANGHTRVPTVWLGRSQPSAADLAQLARGFEPCVVDCPAASVEILDTVLSVADMILLPCSPRPAEVWALGPTLDCIRRALAGRDALAAAIVLNAVERTADVQGIRRALDDAGVSVLQACLGRRASFARALDEGAGVGLVEPRTVAAAEVRGVVDELTWTIRPPHLLRSQPTRG